MGVLWGLGSNKSQESWKMFCKNIATEKADIPQANAVLPPYLFNTSSLKSIESFNLKSTMGVVYMFENCTFCFGICVKLYEMHKQKTIISNISRLTCTINGCLKIDWPQDVNPSNMFHTPLADLPLVFQRFGQVTSLKVSMPCTHCNVSYASKKVAFRRGFTREDIHRIHMWIHLIREFIEICWMQMKNLQQLHLGLPTYQEDCPWFRTLVMVIMMVMIIMMILMFDDAQS